MAADMPQYTERISFLWRALLVPSRRNALQQRHVLILIQETLEHAGATKPNSNHGACPLSTWETTEAQLWLEVPTEATQ